MEEKLYFRPAKYGKGLKKKARAVEKTADDGTQKEKKGHKALKLVCFLLFLAIIIFIIIWLLRGKSTTSGQYPANVRSESLTCETDKLDYEKLTQVKSKNRKIEISAIFDGTTKLKSVSLLYTMYFGSEKEIYDAENISNAELSKALAGAGFAVTDFNKKFSKFDDGLTLSLYSTGSQINEYSAPFFLVDAKDGLPTTLKGYKDNYEKLGFSCQSTAE